MIYAIKCKATDGGATIIGKTLQNTVYRFGSEESYQKELDSVWTGRDGDNLVKVDWGFVWGHFGTQIIWVGSPEKAIAYSDYEYLRTITDEEGGRIVGNLPIADDASKKNAQAAIDTFNEHCDF